MPILDSVNTCGLGVKEMCDFSIRPLLENSCLGNGTHQVWFQHHLIPHKDRLLPDPVLVVVGWQNDWLVLQKCTGRSWTAWVSNTDGFHETTATASGWRRKWLLPSPQSLKESTNLEPPSNKIRTDMKKLHSSSSCYVTASKPDGAESGSEIKSLVHSVTFLSPVWALWTYSEAKTQQRCCMDNSLVTLATVLLAGTKTAEGQKWNFFTDVFILLSLFFLETFLEDCMLVLFSVLTFYLHVLLINKRKF